MDDPENQYRQHNLDCTFTGFMLRHVSRTTAIKSRVQANVALASIKVFNADRPFSIVSVVAAAVGCG
jgi:hypothetical protein